MFPNLHSKNIEAGQTQINGKIVQDEIDQKIGIYNGVFKVIDSSSVMHFDGVLEFSWYPTPGVSFSAKPISGQKELKFFFSRIEVYINDVLIGTGRFTDIFGEYVEGCLTETVIGNKEKRITKFVFSVPNLRKIDGLVATTSEGANFFGRRISLNDDLFDIEILRLDDDDVVENLGSMVRSGGGYLITHVGEISSKDKYINIKKLELYLHCLDYFLSFMNGQRTSVIFGKGYNCETVQWSEYAPSRVDAYLGVVSWAPTLSSTDFNDFWRKFLEYWKTDEKLMTYGLHWYFEANKNAGLLEGSLILAQTALETFCNWIVLEKLRLVKGSETKSLSAANKIRILLGILGVSADIPNELKNLKIVKHPEKPKLTFNDGPEALTEIRNMLTHGSTNKYKTYNELDVRAVHEAKQLCLWYVEVALLFSFGYNEKYTNRITRQHEYPPFTVRQSSL